MKNLFAIACFLGPLSLIFCRIALADDDDTLSIEKVQGARKAAEAREMAIAADVHQDLEAQIKDVQSRLDEVRKWTHAQFEVSERGIIDRPEAMTNIMKSWQNQRRIEIDRLIQFPEKSGGGIESGRALNAMLESLGPAALQNAETRKIKPDAALPLTEPPEMLKVEKSLAEEITWQENVLGAKTVGQGSRDILDLDWPPILRREEWKTYRERFEDARKKALAEVANKASVTNETDQEVRSVVAELNKTFAEFRSDWVCHDHPEVDRPQEYRRICDGSRHIQKLVMGAYQLAELTPAQVSYRDSFQGGSIEEYIAFFQRHNRRFAPAAPANRSAYYKIFQMMARYYLDEKFTMNVERDLDQELSTLKVNDQHAIDAALGRVKTESDKTSLQLMQMKIFDDMIR